VISCISNFSFVSFAWQRGKFAGKLAASHNHGKKIPRAGKLREAGLG
jgi:hypothetical protein